MNTLPSKTELPAEILGHVDRCSLLLAKSLRIEAAACSEALPYVPEDLAISAVRTSLPEDGLAIQLHLRFESLPGH
jgi:hypothetical protein